MESYEATFFAVEGSLLGSLFAVSLCLTLLFLGLSGYALRLPLGMFSKLSLSLGVAFLSGFCAALLGTIAAGGNTDTMFPGQEPNMEAGISGPIMEKFGERKAVAVLGREDYRVEYDPDTEKYTGMVVHFKIDAKAEDESRIQLYDVTVDLDGTTTFEKVGNDDDSETD